MNFTGWIMRVRAGRRPPANVYTLTRSIQTLCQQDPISAVANRNKKKKDAQLVVRMNKRLRDRFMEVCDELDTTGAHEVRRFIKRFEKGEAEE